MKGKDKQRKPLTPEQLYKIGTENTELARTKLSCKLLDMLNAEVKRSRKQRHTLSKADVIHVLSKTICLYTKNE